MNKVYACALCQSYKTCPRANTLRLSECRGYTEDTLAVATHKKEMDDRVRNNPAVTCQECLAKYDTEYRLLMTLPKDPPKGQYFKVESFCPNCGYTRIDDAIV